MKSAPPPYELCDVLFVEEPIEGLNYARGKTFGAALASGTHLGFNERRSGGVAVDIRTLLDFMFCVVRRFFHLYDGF